MRSHRGGAGGVTQHGIAGAAHDVASGLGMEGLFTGLGEQRLEVRHAELVIAAHHLDRLSDT